MLSIRSQQMEVFARAGKRRFLDAYLEHVQRAAPALVPALEAPAFQADLEVEIERGHEFGFSNDYDLVRYLDLVLLMNAVPEVSEEITNVFKEFDRDPSKRLDAAWHLFEESLEG